MIGVSGRAVDGGEDLSPGPQHLFGIIETLAMIAVQRSRIERQVIAYGGIEQGVVERHLAVEHGRIG